MATKTNSANGTSNRPNATEMRDWYEKNKHSLEMYAKANVVFVNRLDMIKIN